jgi:hypothetical protein
MLDNRFVELGHHCLLFVKAKARHGHKNGTENIPTGPLPKIDRGLPVGAKIHRSSAG